MLQRIIEFLFKPAPVPPSLPPLACAQESEFRPEADDPLVDVPRYPPFDTGIPVKSVERIVASQRDLIGRIYRAAGVSREEFAERIQPVIESLARYVHLLPATASSYHRGAGGLFRLSLEVGLHAMQAANASVFPTGGGVERRFFMQPKWSLATLLAGVCSQLYRTINHMTVLDRNNNQWPALITPLYDWAVSRKAEVYFIRWLDEPDAAGAQASAAYLVNLIVLPSTMQYLAADNNQVIPAMTAAITGAAFGAGENTIARTIASTTTCVIEEDLKRAPMNYGHMSVGIHLEPHLIDAMRRLVKAGTWMCNTRAAAVWVGSDGVFINWALAANEIVNLLTRESFAGVPRDPDTLAEMLCKAGVFERTPTLAKYWTITLPQTAALLDGAVKLRARDMIFPAGYDFSPYAHITLGLMPAQDAPGPKPTPEGSSNDKPKNAVTDKHPAAKAGEPRTAQEPGIGPMADRLLGALKKENASLLREIHKHYRTQSLTGVVACVPQGLGISHEELTAHGQPVMDLLEELAMKQWLWVDKTKPTRKIHLIEVGGRQERMIVLKPDIARGLGFVWEAK